MILCRGLGGINIKGGAGDFLFLDCFGQGHFIQHFAASIIHDQQIGPALVEKTLAIEQMPRSVAAGDMESDDIDLAQELIEVADHFHAAVEHVGGADKRIKPNDGHVHCQSTGSNGSADPAHPNHAQRFAGELGALELAAFFPIELAGLEAGVRLGDFPSEAHHQGEGMLGSGKG